MANIFEEEHELDLLEELFEFLELDGPDNDQMFTLYGVFKKDFIDDPILIDFLPLKYDRARSQHPLFRGKPRGFEHICTRGSKHSGKRNFDPERANKIHWIRPVLHFKEDNRIKYFERVHSNGQNQHYYWLAEKSYVVIIREITSNLQLVTAFKVDQIEERRFQEWYREYLR
jgi:hypothetical protein